MSVQGFDKRAVGPDGKYLRRRRHRGRIRRTLRHVLGDDWPVYVGVAVLSVGVIAFLIVGRAG